MEALARPDTSQLVRCCRRCWRIWYIFQTHPVSIHVLYNVQKTAEHTMRSSDQANPQCLARNNSVSLGRQYTFHRFCGALCAMRTSGYGGVTGLTSRWPIGVGAQSTLGARHLCPKINVWKINKMPEFYMIFAGQIFFRSFLGDASPLSFEKSDEAQRSASPPRRHCLSSDFRRSFPWFVQGVPEKNAQCCLCATILQPYVIESCGFQQNFQKEIVYTTKAS